MSLLTSNHLSPAQRRIAWAIAEGEAAGRPALVPDLVQALGYGAESSISATLRIMERNGFLEIVGGGTRRATRILRLTKKARQMLGVGGLSVVGRIAAGPLQEALADSEDFLESTALLPHRPGDFLLRVSGDSMIGDGIRTGDLVLLRPGVEVRDGEIAAAYVGDDFQATLKHVHPEKKGVRLRASNPAYPDLFVSQREWQGVAGVFRGLIRHAGQ
jgi:repressor LexA